MSGWFARLLGKPQRPRSALEVIQAYGAVLAARKTIISDVGTLPFPKREIKLALLGYIASLPPGPDREQFRVAFISLGDFQDLAECRRLGKNPDELGVAENLALLEELKAVEVAFAKGMNE
jgi:hypothetical protein